MVPEEPGTIAKSHVPDWPDERWVPHRTANRASAQEARVRLQRGLVAMAALFGTASIPGIARAQLILQNFPTNIPGYEPNLGASVVTRMMQEDQANGVEIGD